jgi:hypothetical protein
MGRLSIKQKPIRTLIIVALALIISSPIIFPQKAAAQTTQYYDKSFAWDYNGKHWTWNLSVPKDLYDVYKSVPVSTRTRNGPGGYGFCTTTQDSYIQSLAKGLNQTAQQQHFSSFDQVSFVLAFVQSLPYTSDNVTEGYNEYPRFPIETLVDDGGDCEDTSILFATLTLIMGYGTVYINPPNHYAVGILGNNLNGVSWTYPQGSNKTYYYCETTGDGFKIGQLPDQFQGQNAFIYPIDESKQFIPQVIALPTVEPTSTDAPSITWATTTPQPNPTSQNTSPSPTITQPSVQPPMPLFSSISENPLLFIIIAFAIVVSISLAVWSVRRQKMLPVEASANPVNPEQSLPPQEIAATSESHKFCIFCGSKNKDYASFCESCGKQIGNN